jgi:hypothetical protein
VSKTGGLKATATLGDGKRAVLKSSVDSEPAALLHAPLYRNPKGFICGKIAFITGDPDADSRGNLTWVKPLQSKPDMNYPSGFEGTTAWQAARYARPISGIPIFGPSFTSANATLEHGGLPSTSIVQKLVTLLPNSIQIQQSGTDVLTLSANPASGIFSGKYTHPLDLKKRPLSGVLYQKQQIARGLFNGVNESGQAVTGNWMLVPQ